MYRKGKEMFESTSITTNTQDPNNIYANSYNKHISNDLIDLKQEIKSGLYLNLESKADFLRKTRR